MCLVSGVPVREKTTLHCQGGFQVTVLRYPNDKRFCATCWVTGGTITDVILVTETTPSPAFSPKNGSRKLPET